MASTFVVVPQWQGSGSSRAMRLIDGAEAIRGDLPSGSTRVVEVPLEAGDDQGSGIHRLSSIQLVRERLEELVAGIEGPVVTVGGDCGVEWGAASRFAADDVALVWVDAHGDLNTAEGSPTGAFHGMVLRRLIDDGFPPGRVVLAGTRALDEPEESYLDETGIRVVAPDALRTPDALVAAVEATRAASVYLHVDLDVLDPSELGGLTHPEPFGLTTGEVVAAIRALRERFGVVSAGLTEFSPASADAAVEDLPNILRIIGALAR